MECIIKSIDIKDFLRMPMTVFANNVTNNIN